MPRFSRLLIYDAEDDTILCEQIQKSLAEGIHDKGHIKITVINLSSVIALNAFVADINEELVEFESTES